jgi:hypothetical protein
MRDSTASRNAALCGLCVGFPVGFSERNGQEVKARQAASIELDVQVQNIE